MEQHTEIRPARAEDFPAIRGLCNSFLDWCRARYGENAWFVDHYYTPEKWAALLESLPRIDATPEGAILGARVNDEALRLYRSLGFQEIGPYYDAPPELGNHLIFMEARLHSLSQTLDEVRAPGAKSFVPDLPAT